MHPKTQIKKVEWTERDYLNESGSILVDGTHYLEADWTTTLDGFEFAAVRVRDSFGNQYIEAYIKGDDGKYTRADHSNSFRVHWNYPHPDSKTPSLVDCNGTEGFRGIKCSICHPVAP